MSRRYGLDIRHILFNPEEADLLQAFSSTMPASMVSTAFGQVMQVQCPRPKQPDKYIVNFLSLLPQCLPIMIRL